MQNLTPNIKTIRVSNAVAAGATDIDCTAVDMQGFSGARFIALFGTLTASQVTSLTLKQSDDDGSTDAYSTIKAQSAMADDDDNQICILEVVNPGKRYLKLTVERATANAVLDGVIVELFHAQQRPVTQDAGVSQYTVSNNPAEV